MATIIILGLVGLLLFLIGLVIWYYKLAGFVAGYDPGQTTDPDAMAQWVGKCTMGTGVLAWVIALLSRLSDAKNSETIALAAFMIGSHLSLVVLLAGLQRYKK